MATSNYVLHVSSGNFPSWSGNVFHRSPNLHVEARLSNQVQRTRAIRGDTAPAWNENILLRNTGSSSKLVISVKDAMKMSTKDRIIGEIEIKIGTLLEKCSGSIVPLTLECRDDNKIKTAHIIHVRLTSEDSTAIAGLALKDPRLKLKPSNVSLAIKTPDDPDNDPFISSLLVLVSKLDVLVNLVDKVAKVHPYVNLAWQVTSSLYKVVKGQSERDEQLIDLVKSMEEAYSFVESVHDLPEKVDLLRDNIEKLVTQTIESAILVREYTGHGFSGRLFRQTLSSEVVKNVADMTQRFIDLKAAFTSGMVVHSAVVSCKVLSVVENLERMQYLRCLNHVSTDASLRSTCLPNTRQSVLDFATEWVMTPTDSTSILWLHGLAGSGKSAIATTLAEYFRGLGRLGAFLFFSRNDAVQSNPAAVVRTLAYQLAQSNDHIGDVIAKAVRMNQNRHIDEATLEFQVSTLLLPLKAVPALEKQGPVVVLLDATDECGTVESRKPLLDLLSKELAQLPVTFRIVITSRNEPDIRAALRNKPHVHSREVTAGSPEDLMDVRSYISYHLQKLQQDEDLMLPPEWPSQSEVEALVKRSAGLFIWASTAVKFIASGPDPIAQAETLCQSQLRHEAESALDEIYALALQAVNGWNNKDHQREFCSILGAVVVGRIPMSDATLDRILGLEGRRSSVYLLSRLTCLLAWSKGQPVQTLHASFADYLFDRERCGEQRWYIDVPSYQLLLTKATFRIMTNTLQFNICGLATSHIYNDDVSDLPTRIQNNIPEALSYSCRFWADHLNEAALDADVLSAVHKFLCESLLYWMEVLSLTEEVARGINALTIACLRLTSVDSNAADRAADAKQFLANFRKPISESAPHVYLSALPFSPTASMTALQFLPVFNNTIEMDIGKPTNWPLDGLVFEGHMSRVTSVAFSQDGKRIVSGSGDKTVRVWEAETGEAMSRPFQGHAESVNSVAFSPDGKRIASGSNDNIVWVWDAETGKIVLGPLDCHTSWVSSVMFSPDGKRIASGSRDHTVLVWDAETGEVVSGPFEGHTDWVRSAVYSLDGKRIVSGSDDKTVRVWNAETGQMLSGPFSGHTEPVTSVAFSPNGKWIVSGSDDKTVQVWEPEKGERVSGPFHGHVDSVTSVRFSPDGKHIASGSRDQTVRVWDAETGEVVSGPFQGHADTVTSVAYSPDGKWIISGSTDQTVRVWDIDAEDISSKMTYGHMSWVSSVAFSPDSKKIASGSRDQTVLVWDTDTGEAVSGPFLGHTDWVRSVTFSPDGKRIASGSYDKTVRIWDAETGEAVSKPFCGHTDSIYSVAFSPAGKRVVSGSSDKTVRIWDTETGEAAAEPFVGHTEAVNAVAFSPDGKQIASGSYDTTVRVWDAETGKLVLEPLCGHADWVSSVVFSPDGKHIASGSGDKTVIVWDAKTGEVLSGPLFGHTDWVNSVGFSPDGRWVVSGSDDETVRVWDAETEELVLGPFHGHMSWVTSVAFSPDGRRIVSGSRDLTVRVWDAETGEVISNPPPSHGHGELVDSPASGDQISCGLDGQRSPVSTPPLQTESDNQPHKLYRFQANLHGQYYDDSPLRDGWMLGTHGELLIWIPHQYRTGLWRPSSTMVIGRNVTRLNFSRFKHGVDWTGCRSSART